MIERSSIIWMSSPGGDWASFSARRRHRFWMAFSSAESEVVVVGSRQIRFWRVWKAVSLE